MPISIIMDMGSRTAIMPERITKMDTSKLMPRIRDSTSEKRSEHANSASAYEDAEAKAELLLVKLHILHTPFYSALHKFDSML